MLWGGRFSKKPKEALLEFNSSENIELDSRLITLDIVGSIAHVKMLAKQKILDEKNANEIIGALKKVKKQHEEGKFKLGKKDEDVHTAVEHAVTNITQHGKNMHIARSRNDQVLLDTRMYMRNMIINLIEIIGSMQNAFAKLSKKDSVFPSYTHTRIAQPITLSFWCDSYVKSLERDKERLICCYKRVNQNPLGAGAVAGTGWNIDRSYTAKLLGFDSVQENALDVISSRGEMEAELIFTIAMVMTKISRLTEELIWLSQKELVNIPDEYCTGSSMMPNKKNADLLELSRARAARVYGNLIHALATLKGTPSGYNSDGQETKYAMMSAIENCGMTIAIVTDLVPNLKVNEEKITDELNHGFAQATEIADLLVKKGVPFRDSHKMVGELIKHCEGKGKTFSDIVCNEANKTMNTAISEKEWKDAIALYKKRLEVKIAVNNAEWVKVEKKKLDGIYKNLLN